MFYLHVYVCIVHILCMKMHCYFLLKINMGPHSKLYLGSVRLWGEGASSPGGGAWVGPLRGPGGLQLSSAGTVYHMNALYPYRFLSY